MVKISDNDSIKPKWKMGKCVIASIRVCQMFDDSIEVLISIWMNNEKKKRLAYKRNGLH
jgi:hypothetical protein